MLNGSHAPVTVLLASYWGKADPKTALRHGGHDHHTVLGHSLDVAACAFVLVDRHPTLQKQFAASTEIAADAVAITVAGVCALHDVGKFDTRFQRKAPQVADVLRPKTAGIPAGPYDHGSEGFRQIEDDDAAKAHLHTLLGTSALSLLCAVCGHHGVLPSREEPNPSRTRVPGPHRREDALARKLFQDCVVGFFVARGATLPWTAAVSGAVVQRLSGLCAIADWVGSNVEHFPYAAGAIDLQSYWTLTCARAIDACADAGLLRVRPAPAGFKELFPGYSPRDVQILTEQVAPDGPALVIVEAEMGKGKTEAALALAARLLARGIGDGLTVALPTMATSNAMFARVEDISHRLFPVGEVQLALAHSRASRQPRFRTLIQRGLRAHDLDAPEASVMCARWLLQRKRILLAQVGVGTIDQALQSALIVRHQFVRMFALSRNVVIIDEVHAYDAYMEVLLEHLLSWLGVLGVPVILLSATLPSRRHAALVRAWRGGQSHPQQAIDQDHASGDDLETARTRPYPLVSITTTGGSTTRSSNDLPTSRTLHLGYQPRVTADAPHVDAAAARLVSAARAGGRVVWVRNTVREAQDAFRAVAACADGVEHSLFHARFRGCDRNRVERSVLERFGKEAPPGGRVLIATQVVEQSLDLDFDEMHTDLAPIDLVLQRAGRLHRHARGRPSGFERPHLTVHGPSDPDMASLRFGPSQYVYDVGTLWIAGRTLRGRTALHLPVDIRPLVEETYHPDSRDRLLTLGGPELVAAENKRAAELEARRTKARRCCISPATAEPGGIAALDDDEDAVYAFTRDGVSATLLPFWWDGHAARILDAEVESPVWHLDADRSDAWQLASELLDQTVSLPARSDIDADVASHERTAWAAWRTRFRGFADECAIGSRVVPLPMTREGDAYKGWLRVGPRRRRVLYSPILGLLMPSEKDEEQAR